MAAAMLCALLTGCAEPDRPEDVFWEMYRRQATQTVVHTRREYFETPEAAAARTMVRVSDEIYDYASGRHVGTGIEHWRGRSVVRTRCVDGAQYGYLPSRQVWDGPESSALCQVSSRPGLGDGVIPGGLTDSQAEEMIASLRGAHHFLTPLAPVPVDVDGHRYLRIEVRVRPVEGFDMPHLLFALRDAGLDPGTYPFQPADDTRGGADLTYYADPVTLLPEFVHRRPLRAGPVVRVEYLHPATVPENPLADTTPWTLRW
ncbi:hypothetical protein SAMN05660874_05414 [Saccharopolyspora flava]|uniref:Lipoprotein n=2 Tax=Saccharopolyspora flava TaxID=95161 RepID=A0A1I6UZB9_9PSEU|nr:hypothetical protein SAMN05660874_05414 [Saccharopolyspora flava]